MASITTDPGEKSLITLLSTLTTVLHPTTYVFATVADDTSKQLPPLSDIQMLFRESESEGITVIVSNITNNRNSVSLTGGILF